MKDTIRAFMLFLIGFFTFLLIEIIPVAGGGMAIVFLFTIPILIGLGFILSLIYYFSSKKIEKDKEKDIMFYIMFIALVLLNFILFPYA